MPSKTCALSRSLSQGDPLPDKQCSLVRATSIDSTRLRFDLQLSIIALATTRPTCYTIVDNMTQYAKCLSVCAVHSQGRPFNHYTKYQLVNIEATATILAAPVGEATLTANLLAELSSAFSGKEVLLQDPHTMDMSSSVAVAKVWASPVTSP